jgi:hypothetical protein
VTIGDEATEKANLPVARSADPNAQTRTRTRARVAAATITKSVRTAGTSLSRDIRQIPVFRTPPPALAEIVAYTRSGAWVPGEQAPWLEFLGKAYGWVLAVPISLCLYVVAWLLQRPARVALASAVGGIVWLTH